MLKEAPEMISGSTLALPPSGRIAAKFFQLEHGRTTEMQAQIANEQWGKYKEIYDPLEKKFVSEAQNYDTPENYAKAAGDASATVSQQFDKARDRLASLTESVRANRDASTSAFAAPAQAPDRKISSSRERFGSETLAAT